MDLLDGAAAPEAAVSGKPAAAKTESNPAAAGADGAEGNAPDLLAEDDKGDTPATKLDGQADGKTGAAPETYAAFTLPDGVEIDEAALAQATPVFKDIGLTQDQAQKLVTQYAALQQAAAQAQVAQFQQVKKDWAAAIKADPEFGGEKLAQTLGAAKAVLVKYGDAQLRSDLKEWGWANHPGLIRMLAKVGGHFSEDTTVTADSAAQAAPKSAAETLWPGMFKQE